MIKKIVLFSIIFLFAQTLVAQTAPASVKRSLLLDIITLSDNSLLAVGERGHILKKSISAKDWQIIDSPTEVTLTAIFALDDQHLWAVGHQSSILKSQDAGSTWQLSYQALNGAPLMDVVFFNSLEGIAVGAYGTFLRTSDGGLSWQKEVHAGVLMSDDLSYLAEIRKESESEYLSEVSALQPHFNRLNLLDNGQLILVGEMGLIAVSQDKGLNWTRLKDIYEGSFFAVSAKNLVIVAGLRGHVFYTHNDAKQRINANASTYINSVRNQVKAEINWKTIALTEPVNINSVIQLTSNKLDDTPLEQWLLIGNSQTVWLWQRGMKQAKPIAKVKTNKALVNGVSVGSQLWLVGDKGLEVISIPKAE